MTKYCQQSCEQCPFNDFNEKEKREAVEVLSDLMGSFPADEVLKSHELGFLREDVVEIVSYENGVWPDPDAVTAAEVRIALGKCVKHPLKTITA